MKIKVRNKLKIMVCFKRPPTYTNGATVFVVVAAESSSFEYL